MVFMQMFVSCESMQYKRSAFAFLLNGSLYGKNLNGRNFRIHWTRNWKVVTLDRPNIDIELLQRSQLSLYERCIEHPTSLLRVKEYPFGHEAAENLMRSADTP